MARRLVAMLPIVFVSIDLPVQGARLMLGEPPRQTPSVRIDLAHNSERERKTKETLEQALATYDLKKYTLTRRAVIEEGAIITLGSTRPCFAMKSGWRPWSIGTSCDRGRRARAHGKPGDHPRGGAE